VHCAVEGGARQRLVAGGYGRVLDVELDGAGVIIDGFGSEMGSPFRLRIAQAPNGLRNRLRNRGGDGVCGIAGEKVAVAMTERGG